MKQFSFVIPIPVACQVVRVEVKGWVIFLNNFIFIIAMNSDVSNIVRARERSRSL